MNLKTSEFQKVRNILYDYSGISLQKGKEALVRARLMKRIRKLGLSGFDKYLSYIDEDESGAEFLSLVDVLTTNKTSFFREIQHFEYIRDQVIPEISGRPVKWWSAGCSSGEEPITMAMTLLEEMEQRAVNQVKILATDLSREVISVAKAGVYTARKVVDVPDYFLHKYFMKIDENHVRIGNHVRSLITYGRLNLKDAWPLKGPFQLIMCRNVMIYFDRPTQQELVAGFYNLLEPGGYLFLGHSESISGSNHGFKNICPAVYQKH